ncbi:MAG: 2OG-Fe(II) oxygenase [Burkholderiaceae bacterium]|nr:2OG-Fe(II) oxygenase [Burkholderiaceae bacterium]
MTSTAHAQHITDDLRQWLRAQLAAGCRAEDVLSAMRNSGWADAAALQALQQVQQEAGQPVLLPPTGPVPEPAIGDGVTVIDVDGHPVRVLLAMKLPRVVLFGGLLSDAECDALVEEARPRLARSETVVNTTGGSEVNAARTSDGMFFGRGESPLIQRIEQRVARLLHWPVAWGEGLQVLHYRPGAEYRPHHDYFDPKHGGTAAVLKRGGQRVGTLVMYLNTPAKGGATTFPDVALEVAAIKGNAVFFSYDRPHASTRTLHGGGPVVEGEKWVATKWLREREFT